MQITQLFIASSASIATASATTNQDFPASVTQQGILNIQNYINNVINDIIQSKTKQITADYSSAGRSIAFLAQDIIPGKGCPLVTTGHPAQNQDQAIADLQNVQLRFSELSLDIITDDLPKGQVDICLATAQYGDVANYVQSMRTDNQTGAGIE